MTNEKLERFEKCNKLLAAAADAIDDGSEWGNEFSTYLRDPADAGSENEKIMNSRSTKIEKAKQEAHKILSEIGD